MADDQWCLSIRPERHLTSDGLTPLPPERIGRRVTSLKARMFNDKYLGEVNFWRDFLANGSPRFVLDFGNQSAVVSSEFLNFDVAWPGIPGDDLPFKNQSYEEDLFTLAGLGSVVRGEDLDWEDDEDDYDADSGLGCSRSTVRRPGRPPSGWRSRSCCSPGRDGTSTRRRASTLYGPRSLGTSRHKREVHVGFIGTGESADAARRFFRQICSGVPGDQDHEPFPGCYAGSGLPLRGPHRAGRADQAARGHGHPGGEERTAAVRGFPRLAPAEDGPDHQP